MFASTVKNVYQQNDFFHYYLPIYLPVFTYDLLEYSLTYLFVDLF